MGLVLGVMFPVEDDCWGVIGPAGLETADGVVVGTGNDELVVVVAVVVVVCVDVVVVAVVVVACVEVVAFWHWIPRNP